MRVTAAYLERTIRDYQSAYERANGRPAPTIEWQGGWFRFKDQRNKGYRRAALEEMTLELRKRNKF